MIGTGHFTLRLDLQLAVWALYGCSGIPFVAIVGYVICSLVVSCPPSPGTWRGGHNISSSCLDYLGELG